MNRKPFLVGLIAGGLLGLIPGFGLGVYFLPIIVAERGADETVLAGANASAERRGMFVRDLPGSDPLHYGDGEIIDSVENGITYITLQGHVTPGPDYKFYLTPKYVDAKAGFEAIKAQSVRVGDIRRLKISACQCRPRSMPVTIRLCLYGARSFQCSSVRHN